MPSYKQIPVAPALKGVNAAADLYTQPKGSFPRLMNFLLKKRGALDTCDGSQLVHAYNGVIQAGRGKNTCNFLFQPTGVNSYYLAIIKALDIPLGGPKNAVATDNGTGGVFQPGTYRYLVTALDGVGGETIASNEASVTIAVNHQITISWNVVPNAIAYNIYRTGTNGAPGSETLIAGTGLPVPQVALGTLTVTFSDTGMGTTTTYAVLGATWHVGLQTLYATFAFGVPVPYHVGDTFNYVPGTVAAFGGLWTVQSTFITGGVMYYNCFPTGGQPWGNFFNNQSSLGGFSYVPASQGGQNVTPPLSDTTQQTALFRMPPIIGNPATLPVNYNDSNIVALFPADVIVAPPPGGGGGGGSGGGGGTGGGGSGGGSGGTPSGGIAGLVSMIPQIVQFTNRAIIALGNGYPPQIFSDSSTQTNPAITSNISAISVDAFGVVTVTTSSPHGLSTSQSGANVVVFITTGSLYNAAGPTIQVISTTQFKMRNLAAIGQAAGSSGQVTTTAVPVASTFVPGFPVWATATAYNTNNVTTPTVSNGYYYLAKQGGVTGSVQPTWPTGVGSQVADGSIIWQLAGPINTAAPPPPGCAHVTVYAGSLWMLNTSPTNTATGIDGPCSLRMSDVNNPNSWNPINQAFLDKDDGTEGMGLASFTITAQGIPPEGSLVAYKNFAGYQIVGVFGSPSLTIQRIKSDMGCIAPRTLQFVPGFGIARFAHLGFAVFDGVDDRIISEEIRPYLFASSDYSTSDIVVLDATWQSVMWGAQTANPPMWCIAMPVGNSGGQLTQIACYDLVLKSWCFVGLPFSIATMSQFRTVSANPVTILGGFSDGCLSRWQAGDQLWDVNGSGARVPSQVAWMAKLPEAAAQSADQMLNCRRLAIRGQNNSEPGPITVTPIVNGVAKPIKQLYAVPASGDFEIFASYMFDGLRFSAILTGSGQIELDRFCFHVSEKEVGAAQVIS